MKKMIGRQSHNNTKKSFSGLETESYIKRIE